MLKLKNITKDYGEGENVVHALRGIDVTLRKSEFVSILGPSGCGKTTLLNIIGGLDHYTDGDLVINGKSTKRFKDRHWDAYRNHSIGFVFQNYNLIPHQTVLQNVELSLALSGISRSERRERAKNALRAVGLETQFRKKPSEMSGGQMQRVAIARALVNNPDIILADEPTGALDSETSVQVMDILKEVAKDRLVVMVTHNPELAQRYSTRIIRMIDGKITEDTAPMTPAEIAAEENALAKKKRRRRVKKPKMSFATSFILSLKNLFTKKGRTMLASFAGSIGIIGVALIFSVSQGLTNYINIVQEETLASYPLTIEAEHTDMGSLMMSFMQSATSGGNHDMDEVYEKNALYEMVKAFNEQDTKQNDLKSFKTFIDEAFNAEPVEGELSAALQGVQYTYDFDMLIYTQNVDGDIILSDTQQVIMELMAKYLGSSAMGDAMSGMSANNSMMSGMANNMFGLWEELLPGENGAAVNEVVKNQYELVYGDWPTAYNQVLLVVDQNNEIDDMTLYALGLKSKAEIDAIMDAALNKTPLPEADVKHWTYEEICGTTYRTILNSSCYQYDSATGRYNDLRDSQQGLKYLYDNGIDLEVVGIIRAYDDVLSPMLSGSICYTHKLTNYVIEQGAQSDVITAQLASRDTDVLTGLPFKDGVNMTDEEKEAKFRAYVSSLGVPAKAAAFVKIMSIMPAELLEQTVNEQYAALGDRAQIEEMVVAGIMAQTGLSEEDARAYVASRSDAELEAMVKQSIAEQVKAGYAQSVNSHLSALTDEQKAGMLDAALPTYTTAQCATYYEEVLEFSSSSYEAVLRQLGYVDTDSPSSVNLYASSFHNKDIIEKAIKAYNDEVGEEKAISYTDYVGFLMSSMTTIIDAITYVLVAFVAVSLIVSSIMIGVITLISVQERTKEIGILRALGASKRNVSTMFNAETIIIGAASGVFGVGLTYLLCIPINAILNALTGIPNLNAYLPPVVGLILLAISILLNVIAGIIPAKSAAKKDPVVALRTE